MKGLIIEQQATEGVIAWVHGMTFPVRRLFVPDAGRLAVTVHEGQFYAMSGFNDTAYRVIAEVEVSSDFVARVRSFIELRDQLKGEAERLLQP